MHHIFLASLLLLSTRCAQGAEAVPPRLDTYGTQAAAHGGGGSDTEPSMLAAACAASTEGELPTSGGAGTTPLCYHATRGTASLTPDFSGTITLPPLEHLGISEAAVFLSPGTKKRADDTAQQQDNFAYISYKDTVPMVFMGVFDGHGCNGEVASSTAANELGDLIHARIAACDTATQHNPDLVKNIISESFLSFNKKFCTDNEAVAQLAGTTAACVIMLHEYVYVAHAGNSRIMVVLKKGADGTSLVITTEDHELSNLEELIRVIRAGCFLGKNKGRPEPETTDLFRAAVSHYDASEPAAEDDRLHTLIKEQIISNKVSRINAWTHAIRGFGELACMGFEGATPSDITPCLKYVAASSVKFDGSEAKTALPTTRVFLRDNIRLITAATTSVFEPKQLSAHSLTNRFIANELLEALDYKYSWTSVTNALGLEAYNNAQSSAGVVDNLCLMTVQCC